MNWDDDWNLVNNPDYRGLTWRQLRRMLTTFLMRHWIPLAWAALPTAGEPLVLGEYWLPSTRTTPHTERGKKHDDPHRTSCPFGLGSSRRNTKRVPTPDGVPFDVERHPSGS